MAKKTKKEIIATSIIRIIVPMAFLTLATLLIAGRIDYWQGWVYISLNLIVLIATIITLRNKKGLIEERMKPGKGMKKWDKVYFALSTPMYLIAIVIGALDAGRFHWGPEVQLAVYILSGIVFLAAHSLFIRAKYVNEFLSSVVRIQTERGHKVCDKGPYRIIRHPSYTAGILFGLAGPVLLGSWIAVIPQIIAAGLLIWRTYMEDETLKKELPGYINFTKKTRFRLIPGIW